MAEVQNYFMNSDIELEDLNNGIKRKILAYNDNIMMVEAEFEKGAIGTMHSHPHEQCTYVLEGAFEFNIGGVKKVVRTGDTMYKEPHVVHGAVCIEKGKLLDVFTPHREDFLK